MPSGRSPTPSSIWVIDHEVPVVPKASVIFGDASPVNTKSRTSTCSPRLRRFPTSDRWSHTSVAAALLPLSFKIMVIGALSDEVSRSEEHTSELQSRQYLV